MDASHALAAHAAAATFEHLPAAVVEATRRFVLSTLGSAIAGTGVRGCEPVFEQLAAWGGAAECTVLGAQVRLPAPHAALLNAIYAQQSDFDDVHDRALTRPYSIVVPVALAVAEQRGDISGRAFLAAVAVGADVTCRLGKAARAETMDWTRPTTLGVMGSAVAAAKLLGIDAGGIHHALGIAYSQVAGTSQAMIDRAMVKRVHPGFAARGAVTAAYLAARGLTAPDSPLEGPYGYFAMYERGRLDRAALLDDLGENYTGVEVTLKAYPSAGFVHASTDAALALVHRHGVRPDQIAAIRLLVTPLAYDLGARPFPPQQGSIGVAAFASVVYGAVTALLHGAVTLRNYGEEALLDPRVLRLARLTTVEVLRDAGRQYLAPATVEVKTTEGALHRETVTTVRGHPDCPMSWDEVVAKFRDCCAFGRPPLDRARQDALVDRVATLQDVGDMRALAVLLAAGG
ncbi:MAG: MmgE/PrpD family protein [Chloroflexi bacterium]|nr:MmgE/PrpD family protein [Chloroflexota bacterium]